MLTQFVILFLIILSPNNFIEKNKLCLYSVFFLKYSSTNLKNRLNRLSSFLVKCLEKAHCYYLPIINYLLNSPSVSASLQKLNVV